MDKNIAMDDTVYTAERIMKKRVRKVSNFVSGNSDNCCESAFCTNVKDSWVFFCFRGKSSIL